MRVCLVSREVSPFYGAGIGAYATAMANAWRATGHEIHLLTDRHAGLAERASEFLPGVNLHAVGVAASPDFAFWPERYAHAVHVALRDLCSAYDFDYIEFPEYDAEGWFALDARSRGDFPSKPVLGLRLHTPTLDCMRLNDEDPRDPSRSRGVELEERALPLADLLLSPTRSLLDIVTTRIESRGLPSPTGRVVPYPFTADWGGTDSASEVHAVPTVLYFGRLERRKGVDVLVRAALELLGSGEHVRFRFIGSDTQTAPGGGSMLAHLQGLARGPHLSRFSFESPRPRLGLARAIRGADVCCFPSRWENFPNACLEAMSLGALVVASNAGGMGEIIEDRRSGLLFDSGSVDSLASALRLALHDDSARSQIRAEAPPRVATLCDPRTVVTRTIDAIESARRARDHRGARAGTTQA